MSSQQQQQKQQYSKGNNFQIAQESSVYAKASQVTDKKQIDRLYIQDQVKKYFNKLMETKHLSKDDKGFYLTIEGKGTFFYKTQRDINNQILLMFKDKIVAQKKIFDKNLELYKYKNKLNNDNIQSKNIISYNTKLAADCSSKIQALTAEADKERKIYANALFRKTMIQSKYTMALHGQNMNMMNTDIKMEKGSQRTIKRALDHVKTMLELQKNEAQLFSRTLSAQDWNRRQEINDLNNKYNNKADEMLRDEQQKTLDKQRANYAKYIAEQKRRGEQEAANIRANAAKTKEEMDKKSTATSTKMDKTAANIGKVSANLDKASKDLDKVTEDFNKKNDEINAALNQLNESTKQVTDSLELAGNELDKFLTKLKEQGEIILSSVPAECLGSPMPPACTGKYWVAVPIFTTAINIQTGQTNIKIFRCAATGHFCASDKQSGLWERSGPNALYQLYDNIPYVK